MWFPNWPLQRLSSRQPELRRRPLILYQADNRDRLQVVLCSRSAAAAGVSPGMPIAEAKGLLQRQRGRHAPHFEEHQPAADRHALQSLAEWALHFSPLVGLDDADDPAGLLLDISGCDHLFGGERELALRMQQNLKHWGYAPRSAVADTIGAAWALARCAREPLTIVPADRHVEALQPLPVEALRLPVPSVSQFRELDIRTIGQLRELPRASLPSRFGPDVLLRLDQALGLIPEQIQPIHPAEPLAATWSSEEPLDDRHGVSLVLRRLLRRVLQPLASRRHGVLCLECRLDCGGDPMCLSVRLVHATAAFRRLDELLQLQLQRVRIPGPVSSIRVEVTDTAPLEARQEELFETEPQADFGTTTLRRVAHVTHDTKPDQALAQLIERLSSRLGAESVCRPRLVSDPQPEHAGRLVSCLERSQPPLDGDARGCVTTFRPLRLLERPVVVRVVSVFPSGPPIRFEWDRPYAVARSWGPERIATGWWRSGHVERDYYRIETEHGQRFWLFRDAKEGGWYLHGLFD